MKYYTVYVDRSGTVEVKLGSIHDAAAHEELLHRPSDFAEFVLPNDKDEGEFLKKRFAGGVTPRASVVVTIGSGQRARAWRVRA
jgi:hypothetical protein